MPTAIAINQLTKRYGAFTALDSLDLDVQQGEALGYLGPNGAGKTTTIRLLLGLASPTSGSASILGMDTQTETERAHARLAYVPGEAMLWPGLTGLETLELLANLQGQTDTSYRATLIDRFDFDPSRKVRALSKGNRQKVLLIAALASRADVLILDEPTSGLDPLMERAFRDSIHEARERGQTVFLSSHILGEVESLCDRVAIIREGKLIEIGTLAQMRHLHAVQVSATFADTPPDIGQIPGVTDVIQDGNRLEFRVQGSMANVMQAIAAADPLTVLSREPSLEELFLAHYGKSEQRS